LDINNERLLLTFRSAVVGDISIREFYSNTFLLSYPGIVDAF